MDVSDRIKLLRDLAHMSQAKFGQSIGVSAGNVGDWERGRAKPGADALLALSRHFNISIDWILTGEGKGPDDHVIEKNENPFIGQTIITASVGTGKSLSILNLLTPEIKKSILLMPPPNKEELGQRLGVVNVTDLDNAVLKHLGVKDIYNRTIEPDILDAGPPDHKLMYFYSGVYDRINYLMSRNGLHSLDLLEKVKEILGPDIELTQKDILNIMDGYSLPDNYVLYAIAKVLKVTPGWILYGDEIGDTNIRSNTNHNFGDARKIKSNIDKIDLPLDIIAKRLKISLYDLYEHMDGISISIGLLDKLEQLKKDLPEWLSRYGNNHPDINLTDSNAHDQQSWTDYMTIAPRTGKTESLLSTFDEDMKQSLKAIIRNYINEMVEKVITSKEELLNDNNVSSILNDIIIDDEPDQRVDMKNEPGQNSIFGNQDRDNKKLKIIDLLKNLPQEALDEIEKYIQYIIFRLEGDKHKEEKAVTKQSETA